MLRGRNCASARGQTRTARGATQPRLTNFRIEPIDTAAVARARCRLAEGDPTVEVQVADAPNSFPCRHCLEDAAPGERMLLFSHSPFERVGPYKELGAVYAHERACV